MESNYEKCLELILKHEGGYVDHPKDPGGATNKGITIGTLSKWIERPATKQEVKDLSDDVVEAIYKANYWNRVKGDDLPSGVDLMVFDFAVNSGVSRASKCLQQVVGATPDGAIGPKTLQAVSEKDPTEIVKDMQEYRDRFYKSLSTFDTFGRGWLARLSSTSVHALDMIEGNNHDG
jgi:lysozyme family protein